MTPEEALLHYSGLITHFTDMAVGQRARLLREGMSEHVADQVCAQLITVLVHSFIMRTGTSPA
jgi:hypothetical protein